MGKANAVTFENVDVVHETEKALCCNIDGEEVWIPKSQIDNDSEVWNKKTAPGKLVITEWIAKKNGLI
jgi:hypothetical protein